MNKKLRRILDRNKILGITRIVIAAGLIIYLLFYVDIRAITETISNADYLIIILVFLMSFLNLYLQFKKWQLVSEKQLDIKSNKEVLHSLFYGISAGAFTPMKVGEFVARSIPYRERSVVEVSIATIIDKTIPLLVVLVVGIVLSAYYMVSHKILSLMQVLYILLISFILIILLTFIARKNRTNFRKLMRRIESVVWLYKIIRNFEVIKLVKGKYLFKLIVLSVLFHLTFTSQFALLILAFSHEADLLVYLYIANLIIFVQVIIPPVAFGELGVREGAAVYLTENFGMNASVGFNAALVLFFINILLPSLYGLYFLIKRTK